MLIRHENQQAKTSKEKKHLVQSPNQFNKNISKRGEIIQQYGKVKQDQFPHHSTKNHQITQQKFNNWNLQNIL